ncbi:MAG: DsrE family protein [Deltaproteobacteria bacterium]
MTEQQQMVVYIGTHAGEDPERASLPFVLGNAALAMDVDAIVALQGAGVYLAKKGIMENVFAAGLPPLTELVDNFLELGGKLWVCSPCIKERKIKQEDLIEGAEIMAAARLTQALLDATATLVY